MSSLLAGKVAIVTGASSGIGRAIAVALRRRRSPRRHRRHGRAAARGRRSDARADREAGGTASFEKTDVGSWERGRLAGRHDRDAPWPARRDGEQRGDLFRNRAARHQAAQWEAGHARQSDRHVLRLQARRAADAHPRAARRGPRTADQSGSQQGIVTARRYALRGKQGRSDLLDQANRGGLCAGSDRLQLHLAGQDRDRAAGLAEDPARLENAAPAHSLAALGRPQDIANAAVFLASDRATYITGSNLVVDGGWLAG